MKNINIKKFVLDYGIVLIGCLILAFGISSILKPNGLITGGVTGLSIILGSLINIPYTYLYYVMTIIIFITTGIFLGKGEMVKIAFLSISFPVILMYMQSLNYSFIQNDMILSTVYYGIFAGTGVGLILKRGFSMGGTDTIAKIIHRKYLPFMSLSQILLAMDISIIFFSLTVFDTQVALYAIITQVVFTKTVDMVLFGFGSKKVKIEIISEFCDDIEEYIIHKIKRGISAYDITGGYSNQKRRKTVSICSPRESMLIRSFIAEVDPNAFVSVLPVISVWGLGVGFDDLSSDN